MIEGWLGDDYLILFQGLEILDAENRYEFSKLLPGYRLVGLLGWDDFIVRDEVGRTYSIPTVPVDKQYLKPLVMPAQDSKLSPDSRFSGKIKWYVKPIVFGGDPNVGENLTWITHEQHGEIVRWWNNLHLSVSNQQNPK